MSGSESGNGDSSTDAEGGAAQVPAAQRGPESSAVAKQSELVGLWRRVSNEVCAQLYPETLEFRADGVYLASSNDDAFREWQAGDFERGAEGEIRMQLSNDAMASYRYSVASSGRLVFEDPRGCLIEYEKAD